MVTTVVCHGGKSGPLQLLNRTDAWRFNGEMLVAAEGRSKRPPRRRAPGAAWLPLRRPRSAPSSSVQCSAGDLARVWTEASSPSGPGVGASGGQAERRREPRFGPSRLSWQSWPGAGGDNAPAAGTNPLRGKSGASARAAVVTGGGRLTVARSARDETRRSMPTVSRTHMGMGRCRHQLPSWSRDGRRRT